MSNVLIKTFYNGRLLEFFNLKYSSVLINHQTVKFSSVACVPIKKSSAVI